MRRITVRPYSGSSNWVVEGIRVNGKRVRRFFPTREIAEAEAAKARHLAEQNGQRIFTVPPETLANIPTLVEKLAPYNKTLEEAVSYYVSHLKVVESGSSLETVIDAFIKHKRRKNKSKRHIDDLEDRLNRFLKSFSYESVGTISIKQIEDWLDSLKLGAQSTNNYRAALFNFFKYCANNGYRLTNPMAKIEKVKVTGKNPGILTPEQLKALLEKSEDLTLYFALGAYAGLRPAEINRLTMEDIDHDNNVIHVNAKIAKAGRRRLVDILPPLQAILDRGEVKIRYSRRVMRRALKQSGLNKLPHNALRHSFASYHLAYFNNAEKLALQMGHMSTSIIFEHYRAVVKPSEAKKYWE